jgi:hypothetical protein
MPNIFLLTEESRKTATLLEVRIVSPPSLAWFNNEAFLMRLVEAKLTPGGGITANVTLAVAVTTRP